MSEKNNFDEYSNFEDLNDDNFNNLFDDFEGGDFEESSPSIPNKKVNDIFAWNPFENSDVNLDFLADTLIDIDENSDKPLIEDIKPSLEDLLLYKKSKLKLSKTKKSTLKIDWFRKYNFWDKKDINLRNYSPKKDFSTLDIRDFSNLPKTETKFDITPQKKPIQDIAIIKSKKKIREYKGVIFDFLRKFSTYIIVTFSLLLTIIIYKSALETLIESGYKNLSILKNAENLSEARYSANNAKRDFLLSKILFYPLDLTLNNSLIKINKIAFASEIINTWKGVTSAIDRAFYIENRTLDFVKNKWVENVNFTGLISGFENDIDYINSNINEAKKSANKANNLVLDWKVKIPEDFNSNLEIWVAMLDKYSQKISKINQKLPLFYDILWKNKARNYLVVFQNSDEIRPTGWFMWSMWELKMFEWKVLDFKKSDIYKYEWDLKTANYRKELAPKWISQLTKYFWLRDSNYYPNFKTSAEKIDSFMDKIDKQFDWVLFVNMTSIKPFLEEIWGVKLPYLNQEFTSENFSLLMSVLVESKKFKNWTTWTPKEILFDFVDEFTKKIKEKGKYSKYASILLTELKNREIVFVPFDKKEYELIWELSLNWELNSKNYLDYNYVVNTSISGNKSDRYIERNYEKIVAKTASCSYDSMLKIIHKNKFKATDELKIRKLFLENEISEWEKMLKIQWKWENIDYVRILLPKNAIVPKNFTQKIIWNDLVVDFYLNTKPSSTSQITIPYALPNENCKEYNYRFYKQSWIEKYNITYIWEGKSLDLIWLNKDFVIEKKK